MLQGKTALITGASKGIGKAIAEIFAANGADLVLWSRQKESLETVRQEIMARHAVQVHIAEVDVRNAESIKNARQEIAGKVQVDIIVNNAGVMLDAPLMMMKEAVLMGNFETNVYGSFLVTQALMKDLIRKRGGSIINISSIVGVQGSAGQSAYAASKSAIIGFTKSLAKELAPLNIRVNALAPGFIDTGLVATIPEAAKAKTLGNIGMKRMGTPEDVAKVALFLASDLSAYVTAQVIGVDGGMTI
ncbi:MAG: SDR family NAD(P)-dependent oxidoreductase [Chitinophagaceae bacterium]